jgi:hypothetical protein
MSKKKHSESNQKPKVNSELEGFNIEIDSFGEIKSSLNIEDINSFLNKNVEDKKLKDRHDIDELKKGKKPSKED